jgi:hypothetical protein
MTPDQAIQDVLELRKKRVSSTSMSIPGSPKPTAPKLNSSFAQNRDQNTQQAPRLSPVQVPSVDKEVKISAKKPQRFSSEKSEILTNSAYQKPTSAKKSRMLPQNKKTPTTI